jgi:hypothetical protein
MKLQHDSDTAEAFTSVYDKLEAVGHQPKHYVFDDKCSHAVHQFLDKKGITRQNAKSHNQKVNTVKLTVKTAKYQMIVDVATLDASCPIQLWIRMLQQIHDTFNMYCMF